MKYELALKLKQAGFPQVGMRGEVMGELYPEDKSFYVPTLEELISEIGSEVIVDAVIRREILIIDSDNLANLYLALNSKGLK